MSFKFLLRHEIFGYAHVHAISIVKTLVYSLCVSSSAFLNYCHHSRICWFDVASYGKALLLVHLKPQYARFCSQTINPCKLNLANTRADLWCHD